MASHNTPSTRAFLSIASAICMCVLVFSGVALFTAPPCSVADRIGWRFCFIGKDGWESIHMSFAIAFMALIPFHLKYNWSAFVNHFRKKRDESQALSRPFLIAILAALALFLLSSLRLPPFSWVHGAHESLKFSWARDGGPREADKGRGRGMGKHRDESPGGMNRSN